MDWPDNNQGGYGFQDDKWNRRSRSEGYRNLQLGARQNQEEKTRNDMGTEGFVTRDASEKIPEDLRRFNFDRLSLDGLRDLIRPEVREQYLSQFNRLSLPNESSSADRYWSVGESDHASNEVQIIDDIGSSRTDPGDVFDPLSNDEKRLVQFAVSRDRSPYRELVKHPRFDLKITRRLLGCLEDSNWLTDDVISAYLNVLQARQENKPWKFLKCHFFNSFFYERLRSSNELSSLMRWTRTIKYKLLDCDKIFVPINRNRNHWVVVVVDVRQRKLQYLDSFLKEDHEAMKKIAWYLKEEAMCKGLRVDLGVESWAREFPKDIPRQKNECDCGVFMLKFIDFHSRGLPLSFKQEHIPLFRRKILIEILNIPGSTYKLRL